jgi:hypothetical protein
MTKSDIAALTAFESIDAAIAFYEKAYHDSLATDDRAFQLANWLRRYKEQQEAKDTFQSEFDKLKRVLMFVDTKYVDSLKQQIAEMEGYFALPEHKRERKLRDEITKLRNELQCVWENYNKLFAKLKVI